MPKVSGLWEMGTQSVNLPTSPLVYLQIAVEAEVKPLS